jgi:hypothetical protein
VCVCVCGKIRKQEKKRRDGVVQSFRVYICVVLLLTVAKESESERDRRPYFYSRIAVAGDLQTYIYARIHPLGWSFLQVR